MRFLFSLLILALTYPAFALVQDDNPLPPPVPYVRDSGSLDNVAFEARTVHTEDVRMNGAGWIRVYFGDVVLGPGSFIRLTAEQDGEFQELDAEALAMWGDASAYFNGESVAVELVAGPGTTGNRLVIHEVAYQDAPAGGFESICGADDRVSSDQDFSGRVEPIGCSAAMWNEEGCLVSAGHCFTSAGSSSVIEFRVPLNNTQCQNQHPPVADQFPIGARLWTNGGVGNDWAVAQVGTNNLGQRPFDRYGIFQPIALEMPPVGAEMEIWGYGTDTCIVSGTQQYSEGQITSLSSTAMFHNADTTGGNSGSGVLHEGTIIAAHTHAGCPSNGSTRIDHPNFAAARANLCIGEVGKVSFQQSSYRCSTLATIVVQDSSLIGAGVQDVTLSSDTESQGGEVLTLIERYAGVFSGTISVQSGPPSPGDGIVSVAHGDTVTARYIDADDGAGGLLVARQATALMDCQGPQITAIQVGGIGQDRATISWTTEEPADSRVSSSGPTGNDDVSESDLVTSHAVQLTGLVGCATYSFSVSSSDELGNLTIDNNGGALYTFDTLCPAVGSIPAGVGGTEPFRAERVAGDTIRLTWDNQCSGGGSTKVLYGPLNFVDEYRVWGAVCDIPGGDSTFDWINVSIGSLWFVVVKDNDVGIESSWGTGAFGERNGAVSSGECDATLKELGATCP